MHFEPIFKEGVITVDNVRTVKAYENAIRCYEEVLNDAELMAEYNQLEKEVNEFYCQVHNFRLDYSWSPDLKEGVVYV